VFYEAEMRGREGVRERALGTLQRTIDEALSDNQRIWITEEVLNGNGVSAKHGVGPAELQTVLAAYHMERANCSYLATYIQGSPSFDVYRIERRSASNEGQGLLPESRDRKL
jgi:hypothetical protein